MPGHRFPFPEFPAGWFAAGFSRELKRGRLLRRRWMGEQLVLFRDAFGKAVAMDAFCPHMGAHFGHGGTVEKGVIRCPFHNFRFAADGRCISTPYGSKAPVATARTRPVVERNGLLLMANSSSSCLDWEIAPLDQEGWTPLMGRSYRVRTHPQETAENSVDFGHLAELHGYRDVHQVSPLELDGPQLRVGFAFRRRAGVLGRRDRWIEVNSEVLVHGLGYSVVDVAVPELDLKSRTFVLPTPIGGGRIEMRAALSIRQLEQPSRVSAALAALPASIATRLVARAVFEGYTRDLRNDFSIWEHKRYLDPPALAAGDGPIGKYRRWARQFYVPATEATTGSNG